MIFLNKKNFIKNKKYVTLKIKQKELKINNFLKNNSIDFSIELFSPSF